MASLCSRHLDLVLGNSYKKQGREETKLENGVAANVFLSDTSGRRMKSNLGRKSQFWGRLAARGGEWGWDHETKMAYSEQSQH